MKFIADVMLGKLAKRLRLLGYDVQYNPAFDDNAIIRLALEQDGIILTRDTGLASRPLARNHVLIESDYPDEQLRQVIRSHPASSEHRPFTRCSICNGLLSPASRIEVRDLVPAYVSQHSNSFMRCIDCGKIYWRGSHVRHMSKTKKADT